MELEAGQVWWARHDSVVGREQAGRRPVLIISNSAYHTVVTTLALVVPVTSVNRGWPNHVQLSGQLELNQDSFAMTEQLRAISRVRLQEPLGLVSSSCLSEVQRWVHDYIEN